MIPGFITLHIVPPSKINDTVTSVRVDLIIEVREASATDKSNREEINALVITSHGQSFPVAERREEVLAMRQVVIDKLREEMKQDEKGF